MLNARTVEGWFASGFGKNINEFDFYVQSWAAASLISAFYLREICSLLLGILLHNIYLLRRRHYYDFQQLKNVTASCPAGTYDAMVLGIDNEYP